jgi:hypothetical protein
MVSQQRCPWRCGAAAVIFLNNRRGSGTVGFFFVENNAKIHEF